jgi:hypothetical protein
MEKEMKNDMEYLEQNTIKMIEMCNEIYTRLGCNFFSPEEEEQLNKTFEHLKVIVQENLDLMYPERKEMAAKKDISLGLFS